MRIIETNYQQDVPKKSELGGENILAEPSILFEQMDHVANRTQRRTV
jgi:hypothetical protein